MGCQVLQQLGWSAVCSILISICQRDAWRSAAGSGRGCQPADAPGKPVHRSVVPLDAKAARPRRSATASAGNLVYLTSVGIVAAAIAGVFFSAGFLLLAPPAGGATCHSDLRVPDRQDRSLHPDISPPSGSDIRPADSMLGAVAV